jgi:alcohol dehydrogenase
MSFSINHLSPVLFGEGVSLETGAKLKELGCKKVLCVYDKGVKAAGVVDDILAAIRKEGIEVLVYDGVLADPPDYTIEEAAVIGRNGKIDGIVAIGGGSTMDTAKAVNILMGNPSPITQYQAAGGGRQPGPGKVLVLLPTTSGTGSEVTPVSVVTNTTTHRKGGILGPVCRATLAIVDPVLTKGMPPSITADTGMDAFAHASEAMTSGMSNPMSDILAEKAISLVCEYLPRAVRNGADMEARTQMAFAAMVAGYAFADALPHFGHAIGHTLGSMFHTPHGNACGIALPEVMRYIVGAVPDKVKHVGIAMGVKFDGKETPEKIGEKVADAIRKLNKEIGLKTLKQHGIKESDLPAVAEMAMTDDTAGFGPREAELGGMLSMLRGAYKE